MKFDLFNDFNKENIILWIKEILLFIVNPRLVVEKQSNIQTDVLFSQYLFYFVVYTFSYLLTSGFNDFNDLLKPSLFNLFIILPILVLFTLSAKIGTGRSYSKKISIFVFNVLFLCLPVSSILYNLYLIKEDHSFLLIKSIFDTVVSCYILYGFSFVIERNIKRSLIVLFVNFGMLGVIYFVGNILGEKYNKANISLSSNDPIHSEYRMILNFHKHMTEVPVSITYLKNNENLNTVYGYVEFNENFPFFQIDSVQLYDFEATVIRNINNLETLQGKLKFQKNAYILSQFLQYNTILKSIFEEINENYYANNANYVFFEDLFQTDRLVTKNMDLDTNALKLNHLIRNYNNGIIKTHRTYEKVTSINESLVFFGGHIIESLIFKNKRITPHEKFLKVD